ncbi:MAG: hypothetical protein JXA22_07330 [Candidatus Thermoplasmatota archaeon]|nr:hypothetical protein [Candidatus Thermoplasmatota archaeon]
MKNEESLNLWPWLLVFINAVLILGVVAATGCIDLIPVGQGGNIGPSGPPEGLRVSPEVNVTSTDYSGNPYSVPYQGVHDRFSSAYNGSDLSVALRDRLIEVMEEKADDLGENGTVLGYCIEETYDDMDAKPYRIPTYAEKCLWMGEDVWAVAFNRCNGWEGGIGHFDLFFVSIEDIENLYVTGCFGCNSTSPIVAEYHCR